MRNNEMIREIKTLMRCKRELYFKHVEKEKKDKK